MSLILNALQRKDPQVVRDNPRVAPMTSSRPPASGSRLWNGFYVFISLLVLAGLAAFIISLARRDLPAPPISSALVQTSSPTAGLVGIQNAAPTRPEVQEPISRTPQDRDAKLTALTSQLEQRDALISDLLRMEQARQAASLEESFATSVASTRSLQEALTDASIQSSQVEFQIHGQTDGATDQETQDRAHRQRIESHVAAFELAVDNGNLADAQKKLDELATLLSPDSLTLLRNRAWLALNSKQNETARKLYLRILERMPDDTNANINLAVIDAQAGERSSAIQRLKKLYSNYPEKNDVLIALKQLEGISQ